MKTAVVTGAGGFIGGHLVKRLVSEGYHVIGVDIKKPEFEPTAAQEFVLCDLRDSRDTYQLFLHYDDAKDVYALAADMGGMEYIAENDATILHNNTLINLNTIHAAHQHGVKRYFYTSSACAYPGDKQLETNSPPLKETDAYPAYPDLEYGWEKLFSERVLSAYGREKRKNQAPLDVRIVRFHNTFGINSDWQTVRAKAPAALCRKIAMAKLLGMDHITVFGDGKATRTYMDIDDCVEGIRRLMESGYSLPMNLGRDEVISVDDLSKLIMSIAGVELEIRHDLSKPQGVRGRNSDNTLIKDVLVWQPSITLKDGLTKLYRWVEKQVVSTTQPTNGVLTY